MEWYDLDESSDFICRMVHPVCAVLATGAAGLDCVAHCLAYISLPFRLVGMAFGAVLALIKAILFLPARLLGWKKDGSPGLNVAN